MVSSLVSPLSLQLSCRVKRYYVVSEEGQKKKKCTNRKKGVSRGVLRQPRQPVSRVHVPSGVLNVVYVIPHDQCYFILIRYSNVYVISVTYSIRYSYTLY